MATKAEVERLALGLMSEHNLNWPAWGFRFSRGKLYLGRCHYNRFHGGTIDFSTNYLHLPIEEIKDTLLHEIAHALAGHKAGHGPEWKAMCRKVGAKPNPKADLRPEQDIEWKWTGVCPNNHTLKRHAKTQKTERLACARCCRDFNDGFFHPKFLFEWHLTADLKAAGKSGVRLITQPEEQSQEPVRISELMSLGV